MSSVHDSVSSQPTQNSNELEQNPSFVSEDAADNTNLQELPLMKRFQSSLRSMLEKHIDRATDELREKREALKHTKDGNIELGCQLYNFQQELAKNQMNLEKKYNELNEKQNEYQEKDANLSSLRKAHDSLSSQVATEMKLRNGKQKELEQLCNKVFYLNKAKEEIKSDVEIMKRAAEKTVEDLSKLESEKLTQDVLVDQLQNRTSRLEDEVLMYEAQIAAQTEDLKSANDLFAETEAEVLSVRSDITVLMNQWNSSLVGLRRRNDAYNELVDAKRKQTDTLRMLECEQSALRKAIEHEQRNHERLTAIMNKSESQIATLKKQNMQIQTKFEAAKQEYSTYVRMLKETESNLAQILVEKGNREKERDALRKAIEKQSLAKHELEKSIDAELRKRLTAEKVVEYVEKLTVGVLDTNRELETQSVDLENKLAQESLEHAKMVAETTRLQEQLETLEKDINDRNLMMNKMEQEIRSFTVQIERKQATIDMLNKKMDALKQSRGGQEVSPYEAKIQSLAASVAEKQSEISSLEQDWLSQQSDLVKNVQMRDELHRELSFISKQLNIIEQKKLRLDNEAENKEKEIAEVNRQLKSLHKEMHRLNSAIFRQKENNETLSKNKHLAELDFYRVLKEKEIETFELQDKLNSLKSHKETLLNELVEIERQVMLWEKKVQLSEETRATVDKEIGMKDLNDMKLEIHRMEVRKKNLLRQQESLVQGLEKAVSRRDSMLFRNEALEKNKTQSDTKESVVYETKMLKQKHAAITKEIEVKTGEIKEIQDATQSLYETLNQAKKDCEAKQIEVDALSEKLIGLADEKQLNTIELSLNQRELQLLTSLKEATYRPMFQSKATAKQELDSQKNRLNSLIAVIEQICHEQPRISNELQSLLNVLRTKQTEYEALDDSPRSNNESASEAQK